MGYEIRMGIPEMEKTMEYRSYIKKKYIFCCHLYYIKVSEIFD